MRFGSKPASSSSYYNSEVALNELLAAGAGQSTTSALSNVSGSASSVTLISANTSRKGFVIFNDSSSALYVKFGATASTSSFTYKVNPFQTLEMLNGVIYTGIIDGLWDSATGNARITELT